jgi:hypothetical protein
MIAIEQKVLDANSFILSRRILVMILVMSGVLEPARDRSGKPEVR